jgi:AraC-like DNA-binding protein
MMMQNRQTILPAAEYEQPQLDTAFPYRHDIDRLWDIDNPVQARVHYHDAVELGYCREGAGVFTVGRKVMTFKPGDIVVIHALDPHQANGLKGRESIWDFFFLNPMRLLGPTCENVAILDPQAFSEDGVINVLDGDRHPRLATLLRYLAEVSPEKDGKDCIRGLLLSFFALLKGVTASSTRQPGNAPAQNESRFAQVAPALQWLQRHHAQKLSVPDLAARCHMCVSGFRRHFHEVMGCSPHDYLTRYRLSMASIELLEGLKTIDLIARDHGYPQRSSFFREFKKLHGVGPAEWANKRRTRTGAKKRKRNKAAS